jgi:hypothetical protein
MMTGEHFGYQIADANPADGLPLRFAMTWYVVDQKIAQRFGDLSLLLHMFQGREDALKPAQIVELRSYRRTLTEDLVNNLRAGSLVARGFMHGHLDLKDIPAGWWNSNVKFDLGANSAEANGSKVVGVLVFDAGWELSFGKQVDASSETISASDRTGAPGAPSSMHLVGLEMRRRHAAGIMTTSSMQAEAKELEAWLRTKHPGFRIARAKTIQNQLGALWRELKSSQN